MSKPTHASYLCCLMLKPDMYFLAKAFHLKKVLLLENVIFLQKVDTDSQEFNNKGVDGLHASISSNFN